MGNQNIFPYKRKQVVPKLNLSVYGTIFSVSKYYCIKNYVQNFCDLYNLSSRH